MVLALNEPDDMSELNVPAEAALTASPEFVINPSLYLGIYKERRLLVVSYEKNGWYTQYTFSYGSMTSM